MQSLPIDDRIPEILGTARRHRRLVLVAPPGSGKTTRVAPALARSGLLGPMHPAVVMLQPRRVAARASARRIAEENRWTLGGEVGYHIRSEKRVSARSIVRVATEGILTRQLLADPFLEGVGAVILDEFHERNLHTDLALALVREAADSVREDLILIVMSATLDAEPIAAFLGDAPIVRVEGRTFPISVEYVGGGDRASLSDRVAGAVDLAVATAPREERGDVLVFLPGVEEIRRSGRALERLAGREDWLVLPLHGSLPGEEQDRALRPADRRKIVLATNVAETSLTIDGVTTVIDSGLARYARHDPARGLDRLELGWISRASADQRAGRAGRTAPGRCLRLWPQREDRGRAAFDEPEVRRVDLASTVLMLKAWGHADPRTFGWFERPPGDAIAAAERLLRGLGATDSGGALTSIGRDLLSVPAHPRLGRLLAAAASRGRLDEGATLAALLSEKDILTPSYVGARGRPNRDAARGQSDLLTRRDALDDAVRMRFSPTLRERGIDPSAARRVADAKREFLRAARGLATSDVSDPGEGLLLALALLSYPDRVCRRRGEGLPTGRMVGGRGVRLDGDSVVKEAEFFVALDARDAKGAGGREARVRIAGAIEPEWLGELFPESVRRERVVTFDEGRGRAVAVDTTFYLDLPIREGTPGPASAEEASRALADWIRPRAAEFLREDEAAAAWLARVAFLNRAIPDAGLPHFDDEQLAEVVASACAGKTSVEAVRRAGLVAALKGILSYAQARLVDEQAPEALAVPTGNRIRLQYEPDRPPVLAVRLQELFGLAETPRVAMGRVPVLLHLLGPNYRPVQVTEDLQSFWNTTYFQVRKDLRNRYPKHSWPEDPWNAPPVAKGRPTR